MAYEKKHIMWLTERSWVHSCLPECSQVLSITYGRVQTPWPSYVHIKTLTKTHTDLHRGREEGHIEGEKKESVNIWNVKEQRWMLRNYATICQMFCDISKMCKQVHDNKGDQESGSPYANTRERLWILNERQMAVVNAPVPPLWFW